jgi:hypothetical protein
VHPVVFQWLDAVQRKGAGAARLHAGLIAQDVAEAFRTEGLDPARYALWCEDPVTEVIVETRRVTRPRTEIVVELEDRVEVVDGRAVRRREPVEVERIVVTILPVVDESGAPVIDEGSGLALTHQEPVLDEVDEAVEVEVPTGRTRLGLRYEQCLVFEAAYQRARVAELERRVATLEGGA